MKKVLNFAITFVKAIAGACVVVLRWLRILKKSTDLYDKEDKEKGGGTYWLLLLLFIGFMFTSCTKNFYDAELRDEVITEKVKIIEESMLFATDADGAYVFSINYLAGFYRLALLGEDKLSEEGIADAIDVYKKILIEKRGE